MCSIETLRVSNGEMDVLTFGEGSRPMVIIPGLSIKSVMLSAEIVARSYEPYFKGYTIYMFDRVKDMPKGYSVTDMAHDTVEAMDLLGVRDACVLGCSQGGMILQCVAMDRPDLVRCAVLGSTSSRPCPTTLETMGRWVALAEGGDAASLVDDMFRTIYTKGYSDRYSDAFKLLSGMVTGDEMERFATGARACMVFDVYDSIDAIKCPVLVIGAEHDDVLGARSSVDIADRIGCDLYMYEGYAHSVFDEAPDYKSRVAAFFDSAY